MRINGRAIADHIFGELKRLPAPKRALAAVLVGEDASSRSFIRIKKRVAGKLSVIFTLSELPESATTEEAVGIVRALGARADISGIIVQLPLPPQVSREAVLAALPPEKDPDCLSPANAARFEAGGDFIPFKAGRPEAAVAAPPGGGRPRMGFMPPAAGAIEEIVKNLPYSLKDARAAVVGSGPLVGRPAAIYLRRFAREVAVVGEEDDLKTKLKDADVVVSGTGAANIIAADMVRPGALVIDFGYPHDADFEALDKKGCVVTPTPGGTGPIVVAKLFENFYTLNGLLIS